MWWYQRRRHREPSTHLDQPICGFQEANIWNLSVQKWTLFRLDCSTSTYYHVFCLSYSNTGAFNHICSKNYMQRHVERKFVLLANKFERSPSKPGFLKSSTRSCFIFRLILPSMLILWVFLIWVFTDFRNFEC